MEQNTKDQSIPAHIKQLTEKEEDIYGNTDMSDNNIKELHSVQSELGQYWTC